MKVTTRTDYAARALLELAHEPGVAVSVATIADRLQLSTRFLEHVLSDLRRAGLVASNRGSHGGYRLTRAVDKISVGEIIRAVQSRSTAQAESDAGYEPRWRDVVDRVDDVLDGIPLTELDDRRAG